MQKNVAAVIIRECPMNNSCRKNRPMCAKTLGITVKSCRSSEWKIRIITEIKYTQCLMWSAGENMQTEADVPQETDMQRLAPGGVISGVYKAGTHEVINIDSCEIEDELSSAIIRDIRGLLHSFKIKTYDEDTGYGLLRHVLVRRGFHSGEVMVVLVLGSPILPSKNNFVKALRKLHPEITTVVVNVNDKQTSMVLGEKETVIYGKGYIEDTLCGCTFRISPKSFYQVNPVQTEILYNKAITYAGLTGKEKVIDAYCGTGTIGLIAASQAKEVIGVELNRDAVRDAVINAKRNNIKNEQFYNADAGKFMVELSEQNEKVDVVFMDPPRVRKR